MVHRAAADSKHQIPQLAVPVGGTGFGNCRMKGVREGREKMGIWRDLQRFLPSKRDLAAVSGGEGRKIGSWRSHLGDRWAGEQITGFRSHW